MDSVVHFEMPYDDAKRVLAEEIWKQPKYRKVSV